MKYFYTCATFLFRLGSVFLKLKLWLISWKGNDAQITEETASDTFWYLSIKSSDTQAVKSRYVLIPAKSDGKSILTAVNLQQ
jgi:hypothetical protein